jgi:hypothetical protein
MVSYFAGPRPLQYAPISSSRTCAIDEMRMFLEVIVRGELYFEVLENDFCVRHGRSKVRNGELYLKKTDVFQKV